MKKVTVIRPENQYGVIGLNVSGGIGEMQIYHGAGHMCGDTKFSVTGTHLHGFDTLDEAIAALTKYVNTPESPSHMSECAYAYSMSCCNGSVYAN